MAQKRKNIPGQEFNKVKCEKVVDNRCEQIYNMNYILNIANRAMIGKVASGIRERAVGWCETAEEGSAKVLREPNA